MRQISFIDNDNVLRGGILLNNGDVICGCCGEIYSSEDVGKIKDGYEIEIIETFKYWLDLSERIKGN